MRQALQGIERDSDAVVVEDVREAWKGRPKGRPTGTAGRVGKGEAAVAPLGFEELTHAVLQVVVQGHLDQRGLDQDL